MAFFIKSKHKKPLLVAAAIFLVGAGLTSYSLSQEKTRNFMLEEVIRLSLSQCFEAPTQNVIESDEVVLRVSLNEQGMMAVIPELISSDGITPGELALAREANVALFLCIPITSANRSKAIHGDFIVSASLDGIRVSGIDATVVDLPDSFEALVDTQTRDDSAEIIVDTTVDEVEVDEVDITEVVATEIPNETSIEDALDEAPVEEIVVDLVEETQVENLPADEASVADISEESEQIIVRETSDLWSTTATKDIEEGLELSRTVKRDIQRRLVLSGYNTRGVDGVFGKGSRAAISAWQGDGRIPVSGYLNMGQIILLKAQTEDALVVWNKRPQRYFDSNGCLREPNGAIVSGRSFSCDLSALGQGFGVSQ